MGRIHETAFWGKRRTTVRKHSGSVFTVTAGASFYTQDHGAFSEPGSEQGYETLLRRKFSEDLKLLEEQVKSPANADQPGGKSARALRFDSK